MLTGAQVKMKEQQAVTQSRLKRSRSLKKSEHMGNYQSWDYCNFGSYLHFLFPMWLWPHSVERCDINNRKVGEENQAV